MSTRVPWLRRKHCPRTPLLSCSTLNTKMTDTTEKLEEVGSTASRAHNSSKNMDSTNNFMDSIKKPAHSHQGHFDCRHPQLADGYPQCSKCLTHTPCHGWLTRTLWGWHENEPLQMTCESMQTANRSPWV